MTPLSLKLLQNILQVVRSYGGDVSRLTVVCRQSIVFEDLAGVAACLRVIAKDAEAMVKFALNRIAAIAEHSFYELCT